MHPSRTTTWKVPSGLPGVSDVEWGSHLCHFYRTAEELRGPLVDFFRSGLAHGDKCLWICGDPLDAEQARAALAEVVPDLAERERAAQISFIDHEQWYAAVADGEAMLRAWVELESAALAEGYEGLRATGNVYWLERDDWAEFAEYEAAVHAAFHERRILALCSYPLGRCSADDVLDVLQNHEFALVARGGRWETVRSATQLLSAINQPETPPPHPDHSVHFFQDEDYPAAAIAAFLADATPGAAAAVLPPRRLDAVRAALAARGQEAQAVRLLDAEQILADLGWVEGMDPAVLEPVIAKVVADLHSAGGEMRIYGELVDVLARRGELPAALALEDIWNGLQARYGFMLWCGYDRSGFEPADTHAFASICQTHGHIHAGSAANDDALLAKSFLAELRQRRYYENERARLLQAERDASARLGLLQQITSELSQAAALYNIGEVICNSLRESLGAARALIVVPDGEEALRAVMHAGFPQEIARRYFEGRIAARLPATDAYHRSTALWLRDQVEIQSEYPDLPIQACAIAALPLMVADRRVGAIALGFDEAQPFDAAQRALLEDVSIQAAWAVERAQLYEAAARERQRAEEAAQAKDRFLAMLGHELRNPLAALSSAAEVLACKGLGPEVSERTQGVLQRQVGHMTRLVDDLLDVERIISGKIYLDVAPVDLRGVLEEILHDRCAQIERQGLHLHTDLPDAPVWVSGDRVRLVQVFDNILTNAIKFSEASGSVYIRMSTVPSEVQVSVRDTGVGIEAQLLPHIFSPFRQARQNIARTAGGLGLGLALVHGLVTQHGGSVRVDSAGLGHGSEFVLRLPLSAPAQTEAPRLVRRQLPVRVLLVEDNPDAAVVLAELLRLDGHEVTVSDNGYDALRCARAQEPDVVLCDIGLPGAMNGYDVARALGANPLLRGVFRVALTGYGGPDDVQQARAAGFDAHVTKPMSNDDLQYIFSRLEQHLAEGARVSASA